MNACVSLSRLKAAIYLLSSSGFQVLVVVTVTSAYELTRLAVGLSAETIPVVCSSPSEFSTSTVKYMRRDSDVMSKHTVELLQRSG